MAITGHSTAREIGAVFAERASREPLARELWVSIDTEEPGFHLWLLIDANEDFDAQRALYDLVYVLDERFPDSDFQLHILNPLSYTRDPRESLPRDAEHIPLRTA